MRKPYKQVVDEMDDVAIVIDEDLDIQFANQAALDYADLSLKEVQGKSIESITKRMIAEGEDISRFTESAQALMRGEEPDEGSYVQGPSGVRTFSLEFELSFQDMEPVVTEQRLKPFSYEDGSPGLCVISRNITARKEKERELELFKEAVENAGHAIYITDSTGTIIYVNSAFEKITGYTAEEAIGNNPRILKSGEHDEEFYDELWGTILSNKTWENELINRSKSGERYIVDQTISPIAGENGDIEWFVAVNTDISRRKLRKQVIEVTNRILRHNMRNQLNVITGRADVVLQDRLESLSAIRHEIETIAEELSQIDGGSDSDGRVHAQRNRLMETTKALNAVEDQISFDANTAKETAQDLVELSEKTTRAQDILSEQEKNSHQLNLSSIIEEEQSKLQGRYPSAEFSKTTPDKVSIKVDSHFRRAITELLENAIKHNDNPRPTVNTSVYLPEAKTLEIVISDNGPGIPDTEGQVLKKGEETELLHGDGIGLWMVHWAITMAGGDLTIKENDIRGSEVTLSLPKGSDKIEVKPKVGSEVF